jgi:hypothetical protein
MPTTSGYGGFWILYMNDTYMEYTLLRNVLEVYNILWVARRLTVAHLLTICLYMINSSSNHSFFFLIFFSDLVHLSMIFP